MKKIIMKFGLLLVVLGFSLTSCSEKEDPSHDPEVVTAVVEYKVHSRYDLLKLVDMTVYYTNEEGKEVSEVVSTDTWKKTITKVAVPSTCNLRVAYVRNTKTLEQDTYKFGKGLGISTITSSGSVRSTGTEGYAVVLKDKVEDYLKNFIVEQESVDIAK